MISDVMTDAVPGRHFEVTPEEQLTEYVSHALRCSGFPPLQYLDVELRDGHVYLSARVPELFLSRLVSRAAVQ